MTIHAPKAPLHAISQFLLESLMVGQTALWCRTYLMWGCEASTRSMFASATPCSKNLRDRGKLCSNCTLSAFGSIHATAVRGWQSSENGKACRHDNAFNIILSIFSDYSMVIHQSTWSACCILSRCQKRRYICVLVIQTVIVAAVKQIWPRWNVASFDSRSWLGLFSIKAWKLDAPKN